MLNRVTWLLPLAFFSLLTAAFVCADPSIHVSWPLPQTQPSDEPDLQREQKRTVELDSRLVLVKDRLEKKQQIVRGLALGTISLEMAIATVREIHANEPEYLESLRQQDLNLPDSELIANNIMDFAVIAIRDDTEVLSQVLGRLNRERTELRMKPYTLKSE